MILELYVLGLGCISRTTCSVMVEAPDTTGVGQKSLVLSSDYRLFQGVRKHGEVFPEGVPIPIVREDPQDSAVAVYYHFPGQGSLFLNGIAVIGKQEPYGKAGGHESGAY
jgi:hypothetical protein